MLGTPLLLPGGVPLMDLHNADLEGISTLFLARPTLKTNPSSIGRR
jgi:hypothetical protein